jgi:hypothetical protein
MEAMFGVPFAPRVANIEPDLIRALKGLALPMVSGRWDQRASMEPRAQRTRDSSPGRRDYSSVRALCDRGAEGAA